MSVTAVVNQKGGVGKTTVALGLASALCSAGRSVLVVDMDPQANATTGLAVWDPAVTIDAILSEDRPGNASEALVVAGWKPGEGSAVPSVVPSSPGLAQVEHQLVSDVIGAQDRLSVALEGLAERFDEVLVDCPPSLGLLTVNALFASDRVIVVTEPAAWSSDGVVQILRNCDRIAARRGGAPVVAGIVVNRVGRTRDATYWADELSRSHPDLVMSPYVRQRAAVAESAAAAAPVHSLNRSGAGDAIAELDELAAQLFDSMPSPSGANAAEHPGDIVDVRCDPSGVDPDRTGAPSAPAPGGEPIGASALVPGFR